MTHNHRAEGRRYDIGLKEALSITLGNLKRHSSVTLSVEEACGRVAKESAPKKITV